MKKNLFSLAAALLIGMFAVSCSNENVVDPQPQASKVKKTFKLETSMGSASTRIDYDSYTDGNGAEGFRPTWQTYDVLKIYDSTTGYFLYKAENPTISSDGLTATWSVELDESYEGSILAFIDDSNGATSSDDGEKSKITYSSNTEADNSFSLSLASQTGKVEDALLYNVYVSDPIDVSTIEDATKVNSKFHHQSAMVKLVLTLPDAISSAETVDMELSGTGLYNKVAINPAMLDDPTLTEGSIALSDVEVSSGKVTAYVGVWTGSVEDLTVAVKAKGYTFNYALGNRTIAAAHMYTAKRAASKATIGNLNVVVKDTSSSLSYPTSSSLSESSASWLTFADGQVEWTSNSTGAPRQATLTFEDGTEVEVIQADETDFKDSWTFYAKRFLASAGTTPTEATSGKYLDTAWKASGSNASVTVSVTYDADAEEISGPNGTITNATYANKLSISGLYDNMVLPAAVSIDYDEMTIEYGVFLDMRPASLQQVSASASLFAGDYVCFAPELKGTAAGSWEFGFGSLGSPNYIWYMGNVEIEGSTTTIRFPWNSQKLNTGTTLSLLIIGIQVDRFVNSTGGADNLVRSTKSYSKVLSGTYGAAYAVIYQANYNNSESAGMYLTKTAE